MLLPPADRLQRLCEANLYRRRAEVNRGDHRVMKPDGMAALPARMTPMSLAAVMDLEHHGWKSLCSSTGAEFYGRVMTDGAVMTLSRGFVLDRDQVVASLNDAPPWSSYEISEERLVHEGDDSAVLVYRGRAWRGGDEPAFDAWMTSVYVEVDGEWRLVSYQQTPIPQG